MEDNKFEARCHIDDRDSLMVRTARRGGVWVEVALTYGNGGLCLSKADTDRLVDYLVSRGYGTASARQPEALAEPDGGVPLRARVDDLADRLADLEERHGRLMDETATNFGALEGSVSGLIDGVRGTRESIAAVQTNIVPTRTFAAHVSRLDGRLDAIERRLNSAAVELKGPSPIQAILDGEREMAENVRRNPLHYVL